jgi:hypothetical protein
MQRCLARGEARRRADDDGIAKNEGMGHVPYLPVKCPGQTNVIVNEREVGELQIRWLVHEKETHVRVLPCALVPHARATIPARRWSAAWFATSPQ